MKVEIPRIKVGKNRLLRHWLRKKRFC